MAEESLFDRMRYSELLTMTSRPVKQFSVAGNIFHPEGRCLTDTVIGNLIFIKCSSYILDLH